MSKSTFFTGQPIFNQLLNYIPSHIIVNAVKEHSSDKYYKKFKSYDHLVTMLYTCFQKCEGIREVVTGLMACHHKLIHLGLKYIPRRSTLSDANNDRTFEFFSSVYQGLYRHHYHYLPDSRLKGSIENRLFLIDSTTISLFTKIMKAMGSHPINGKKKGGAKAHIMVKASDDIPVFTMITHATKNDKEIFKHISLPKGAIVVFDKGYNSYDQFDAWDKQSVTRVTRMSDVAYQEEVEKLPVSEKEKALGVIADDWVILGKPGNTKTKRIKVRLSHFMMQKQREPSILLQMIKSSKLLKLQTFIRKDGRLNCYLNVSNKPIR